MECKPGRYTRLEFTAQLYDKTEIHYNKTSWCTLSLTSFRHVLTTTHFVAPRKNCIMHV